MSLSRESAEALQAAGERAKQMCVYYQAKQSEYQQIYEEGWTGVRRVQLHAWQRSIQSLRAEAHAYAQVAHATYTAIDSDLGAMS